MTIRQIQQISDAHCGPAVVQMLLETAGVTADQTTITQAAGAEATIERYGVAVEQMAQAVVKLAPHLKFLYKYRASLDDLRWVLEQDYGAGVEWQGLFYNSVEEEEAEEGKYFDGRGHYSVITEVDDERGVAVIVNPYRDFVGRDQVLPIELFLRRWWDFNELENPSARTKDWIIDERLLFLVAPWEDYIPAQRGFKVFNEG